MSKRRKEAASGVMLDLWRPPRDAGDPLGCLATTYTFAPSLFDEQCLARFLEIESEVMGEGVDLQRFCRHVIHHDLAWNPATIEQRTGRIDRLGCKAEGRQPIVVYVPYLSGTAD